MSTSSSMVVILPAGDYGSLSVSLLQQLRERLMELASKCRSQSVTLDFSMVQMIGGAFLGILLEFHEVLKKRSQRLTVWGLMPYHNDVFQVTRIAELMTVC